jgi:hypothetical protein
VKAEKLLKFCFSLIFFFTFFGFGVILVEIQNEALEMEKFPLIFLSFDAIFGDGREICFGVVKGESGWIVF